ncbi:sugar transferase [Fusobacterium sp.]|uniref:sugar transferase n=1 Tax=Fusobacterium sp. TaxID=68766 RepID=UPI000C7000E2|nr:sugar transferase [Fusobacterium sp.]
MYKKYFKRLLDFVLAFIAFIIFIPIILILAFIGLIAMKGNPFFFQPRPGKNEKIFNLIKFRTMTNEKGDNGELLPDNERLTKYGKFLRSTSLDELPELFNILKGDMSIVGPRPLAVQYLPYYNNEEKKRHSVLPGLTGLAQINGRNAVNWPERFAYDIEYTKNITFTNDLMIIIKTAIRVIRKENVQIRGTTNVIDFDKYRKKELSKEDEYCKKI